MNKKHQKGCSHDGFYSSRPPALICEGQQADMKQSFYTYTFYTWK